MENVQYMGPVYQFGLYCVQLAGARIFFKELILISRNVLHRYV
jgi:hypothetical protein